MRLAQAIDQYLVHMEVVKNPSLHTLKNYKCWLNRFYQWMGKDSQIEDITERKINDYRFFLFNFIGQRGRKINVVSQNHHLVVIRVMLKFLLRMGEKVMSPEQIELPKKPEVKVNFLNRDELNLLFSVVVGTDIHAKRDRAVLHMLYSTGLRVSELSSLNREDIDLETGELSVCGKGCKIRICFLSEVAREHVKIYLATRTDKFKALFLNYKFYNAWENDEQKRRYAVCAIQRMLKRYALKAGITKKVTPHSMRHSFATDLLNNGADIRSVQEMLGHKSLNTTMIYTHVTNSRLREVHRLYHK